MGTTISLLLPENQAGLGIQIVRTLFAEWEQTLSRFLPDSELSQLNQHAGTPTAVSDLLYHVLTTALTAAQATQGVYDPAMLDQLVQLGYDRTFDDLPAVRSAFLFPGEPGGGWRGIRVNPLSRYVTLPVGIKLDFGGIAKGMAVDAALEQLRGPGRFRCITVPSPPRASPIASGGRAIRCGITCLIRARVCQPRVISGQSPSWQTGVNRPR